MTRKESEPNKEGELSVYQRTKEHAKKWRLSNRLYLNEKCRVRQLIYQHWKAITQVFRNILIDDVVALRPVIKAEYVDMLTDDNDSLSSMSVE